MNLGRYKVKLFATVLAMLVSACGGGGGGAPGADASNTQADISSQGSGTGSQSSPGTPGGASAGGAVTTTIASNWSSVASVSCLFNPTSATCAAATLPAQGGGASPPTYTVIAWNDLGMHCVDGKDYSIFSILPPYNNLHAQVVDPSTGKQVTSGLSLSYEALGDPSGSINTGSASKTNFWQFASVLYGASPAPDYGLNLSTPALSNPVPGIASAAMFFNATQKWYEAEGLPITPYDEALKKNYYPMVKVVARNGLGGVVGTTVTVLPVSDEMTCKTCHASYSAGQAQPTVQGWAKDPDAERDWKRNILRLHDDKHRQDAVYQAALAKVGAVGGLAARADQGTPTLCASCHGSNALASQGVTVIVSGVGVRISALTSAVHTLHGSVIDPATQMTLGQSTNRGSCYNCHPGAVTKCLRGAMSNTPNLDCQSCHGAMAAVGKSGRIGWLQQPNCQACHHDGKRELSAVTDVNTGTVRTVTDLRFATNPDTPTGGVSLYRFSIGHGNLQCEACHGPTHAEYSKSDTTWTSSHDNDILQSQMTQGHVGTLMECSVCHLAVPSTLDGGPHGLHTVGQAWISAHKSYAKKSTATCTYCHGADYRGTPLSQVGASRVFTTSGSRRVALAAGTQVGCYDCHNGPRP